jgi:hypothetical protein
VPLQATTRFRYDSGLASVTAGQVLADISRWFGIWEGGRKSIAAKEPVTVKAGQTEAEVTAAFGAPEKKVLLGAKSVFVYGNLKVVFMDGRVVDAE